MRIVVTLKRQISYQLPYGSNPGKREVTLHREEMGSVEEARKFAKYLAEVNSETDSTVTLTLVDYFY